MNNPTISMEKVEKMIVEIRKQDDLRVFQTEQGENFCKKNRIKSGQLNFLLAIVGAERFKKGNEDKKQEIIDKRVKV